MRTLLLPFLLYCCGSAWALTTPSGSRYDQRIQNIVYNPDDVVRILARPGRTTLIQLEADERLQGEQAGLSMGDTEAWKLSVRGNHIFLKPAAPKPDTNLIVTTNKRVYAFVLRTARSSHEQTSYIVRFIYPDTEARQLEAETRKLARLQQLPEPAQMRHNEAYFMRGHTVLAPTRAWDDGRFTYFRYDTSRDLPVVFKQLPDGAEALTNSHMDGDTLVIHETAARFILRLGQAVLGIENDGYTPDGRFNRSGTSSDQSLRIDRE